MISNDTVRKLIAEQFPKWAHLEVKPVKANGIDNITFHLGDQMLIRLPSAKEYEAQVGKEQLWLPKLASQLSIQIPVPLAQGNPSRYYPWNWSIYQWINGSSANLLNIDDDGLVGIANQLAQFLYELHEINSGGAPIAGKHNYFRGGHPSIYDSCIRTSLTKLQGIIDSKKVQAVWEKAISTKWQHQDVWIHGDLASGNILIRDNTLEAIIDFGCMGVGDPACDLVIAWTLLKGDSRGYFKSNTRLDDDTWDRARGWALWKSCFELANSTNRNSLTAIKNLYVINEVLNEC